MEKDRYVVSACLLGKNCTYKGTNNYNPYVEKFLKGKEYLCVCPEQLGGLPTPRVPSEILLNRVITADNQDVTKNFEDGASFAINLALEFNANCAILKSNSPSCGLDLIYDGTFSKKIIEGNGIFARKCLQSKIKVFTEKQIEQGER